MIPMGIFSVPHTTTVSYWPARMEAAASMRAALPLAHRFLPLVDWPEHLSQDSVAAAFDDAHFHRAVYYRLKRTGHNPRWRELLQDPWLEYDPIRERRR